MESSKIRYKFIHVNERSKSFLYDPINATIVRTSSSSIFVLQCEYRINVWRGRTHIETNSKVSNPTSVGTFLFLPALRIAKRVGECVFILCIFFTKVALHFYMSGDDDDIIMIERKYYDLHAHEYVLLRVAWI